MSFGMDKDHPAMQDQIAEAYRKNIIMLAAASNRGHNYEVTYPARRNEVICVYSTDGNGKSSPSNPTRLKNLGYHFATLGVAVKSAWPGNLPELPTKQPSDKPSERRMTGSSFATPIVAGIAAHILGFAHMHGIKQDLYKKLRSHEGMQEVFAEHLAERTEDGLDYINPGKLFADYRSNDEIVFLIEDTLKRRIGISVGADVFD
jgi:subtilisin family serine protease